VLVSEQALFQRFFDGYAATRSLHPRELKAAQCIRDCGTRAMGAHVLSCPSGALEQLQFHACRHRSCPRCARASRARWVDAQLQRLLPCPHFHVIFTLPHELLSLWACNRSRFLPLFMRCVRESLLELMGSPRFLGATPGLIMSLHTWGRTLSHHPHVHCLLTAGGLNPQGHWLACREGWLLPAKALQHLFRGKLLHALRSTLHLGWALPSHTPELSAWLCLIRQLYRKHWNIEIRPPYDHGRGVLLYLARYAKGGPVPAHRFLDLDGHTVRMPYLDHRDHQLKALTLSTEEFISRVLWHAPPRGLHTTRQAGLYTAARRMDHQRALQQLALAPSPTPWPRPTPSPPLAPPTPCRHCGLPMLRSRRLPASASARPSTHQLGEVSPPHHRRSHRARSLRTQRGPTPRSS
jgi:Putative transposase/Transposase zinc-binding domain